ncbi:MAG: carboxypeptidase regulatory-like domain-containing protein, partial [Terriglobia bacterium]
MVRKQTFFFGDYQGTRQLIGRVRISTVPTVLQRQGIFTEPVAGSVPRIYDPASTAPLAGGGFTRTQFANSAIPLGRVDPVATKLLQRFPLPTSGGTANNYRRVGNEVQNQEQFDLRLDHRFSDYGQLFGRYSYARDRCEPVTPLPDGSGLLGSGALGPTTTLGQSVVTSYTHIFTPRMINELRFGYARRSIDRRALLLDAPPSQALDLPGIPANAAFEQELPTILIAGVQQLGPSTSTNSVFRTDVSQIVEMISIQKASHSIKAGADLRFSRLDVVQPPQPTGAFRFSSLFTDLPGVAGTGFPLAGFLLGQVQDFSIDLQSRPVRPRAMVQEYFIQDGWKATQRLTVNAGVRYTLNFPSTEADN